MIKRLLVLASAFVVLLIMGCAEQPDTTDAPVLGVDQGFGISAARSMHSFAETTGRLDSALQANEAISIVAQIDHATHAQQAGMSLPALRVTLFGNPRLGTPLMQQNPQAGIDLPQKMLVYGAMPSESIVFHNAPSYLAQRHGLSDAGVIDSMHAALQTLAQQVTEQAPSVLDTTAVETGAGLQRVESERSVDATYSQLKSAIQENEALSVGAELDHAANAKRVGMTLPPTKLIVFGAPQLGTPLMQSEPTTGLDLPQKMLVYQDNTGTTQLIYNDPSYLARRHGIEGYSETLQQMSNTLNSLASAATQ